MNSYNTNAITDRVAPLTLNLFRGNPFALVLALPQELSLPTAVSIHLYASRLGRLLAVQPTLILSGRTLTLTIADNTGLPRESYHEISFDGRIVWAGAVLVTKNTNAIQPASPPAVVLYQPPTVSLSVPTGGLSTGQTRYANARLEYFNGTAWVAVPGGTTAPANTTFPYTFPLILN